MEIAPRYRDKNGKPLELFEWADLFEDMDYRRVGSTVLWWGGWVSTVWCGLDLGFGFNGKPLIFETMVFAPAWLSRDELDVERYATLKEAQERHRRIVWKWSNPLTLISYMAQWALHRMRPNFNAVSLSLSTIRHIPIDGFPNPNPSIHHDI